MRNAPYTIDQIRAIAAPIARAYGAEKLSLFGSYARGEETVHSDVDFFLVGGNIRGLIQYYSFVNELEDALGCHVDVVMAGSGDRELLNNIARDEVTLYAAS